MTPDIEALEAFLAEKRDAREYRRALAVKMALKGYAYDIICDMLSVTPDFISQCKQYLRQSCGLERSSGRMNAAQTRHLANDSHY